MVRLWFGCLGGAFALCCALAWTSDAVPRRRAAPVGPGPVRASMSERPVRAGAKGPATVPAGERETKEPAGPERVEPPTDYRPPDPRWMFCLDPWTHAPEVQGSVVGPRGEPVDFAYLLGGPVGHWNGYLRFSGYGRVVAGKLGFDLRNAGDDATTLFTVYADGYARKLFRPTPEQWRKLRAEKAVRDVRIVLQPAATLEGRVLDEGGRPLAGARVWLFPYFRRDISFAGIGFPKTRADAAGRFRIRNLHPESRSSLFARSASAQDVWFADPVPLAGRLAYGETETLTVVAPRTRICRVQVRVRNWSPRWSKLQLDDRDETKRKVDRATFVVETRTGPHRWHLCAGAFICGGGTPTTSFEFSVPHHRDRFVVDVDVKGTASR